LLYVFDDCVLDTQRRELKRGGSAVAVEPQVFDLIACLIEHRDRVVSRDDLRSMVWEGRIVSESTLGSAMNAARTAIGDTGEQQRLIRTLPRKGFRFVGAVRVEPALAAPAIAAASASGLVPVAPLPGPPMHPMAAPAVAAPSARRAVPLRALVMSAAGVAIIAAVLGYVLRPASNEPRTLPTGEKFDASVVPLVEDETRRTILASYPNLPDYKALAITGGSNGIADRHANVEAAKEDVLRRCNNRIKEKRCRLYAVGMDVVWVKQAMPTPAPADLRLEPLDEPLNPMEIPLLGRDSRELVATTYAVWPDHRALAMTSKRTFRQPTTSTRAEATRLAVERCAEFYSRPCLVVSVDGMLTMRIPKSRVTRIFLPSREPELPAEHKERIGRIYQGPEWRALAKGGSSWHAVASAPSEAAAIEEALKACRQSDADCRLYAIGNFRVAP